MAGATVDPITFAVVSSKLWAINTEGAIALRQVSGSPVATEANDMNTTILTSDGEVILAGSYILSGAVGQGLILERILRDYAANPGIAEGDMFLCNDPYSGSLHQNCVTVLGPIFHAGSPVLWAGATLHVADVGGSTPGQVNPRARSIHEEAPVIPPIKIVEGGRLRHDLEEEYLVRSRTRDLNALDLRAKIAAVNVIRRRLGELMDRYGTDVVTSVAEGTIAEAERLLRARLAALPDGRWQHVTYVDHHDGETVAIYPIRLTMTKKGDALHFDFAGSAPQAPAIVNCTYAGVLSGVVIATLAYLCFDIPWSPGAVARVVRVSAEEGTIVNAVWPAGVSKATTAAGAEVTTAASACLAKLLDASDEYSGRVMAPWGAGAPLIDVFGLDQHGKPFGAVLLEGLARGAGAGAERDGIDTGGSIRTMSGAVANVETLEYRYPLLYLSRRQQADSGGAGRQRGGVGITSLVTPHEVDEITHVVVHANCVAQPGGVGTAGGLPGATNQVLLVRGSSVWDRIGAGELPTEIEELDGIEPTVIGFADVKLRRGDVLKVMVSGGGGYGDPLDRDPDAVRRDVEHGLVSPAEALRTYGISVEGASAEGADPEGDRRRLREDRAGSRLEASPPTGSAEGRIRLTGVLSMDGGVDGWTIRCRCGKAITAGQEPYKRHARERSLLLTSVAPWINPGNVAGDRFTLREFFCPQCLTLLDAEVRFEDEPFTEDVVDLGSRA